MVSVKENKLVEVRLIVSLCRLFSKNNVMLLDFKAASDEDGDVVGVVQIVHGLPTNFIYTHELIEEVFSER